jgi:hypothetical protein
VELPRFTKGIFGGSFTPNARIAFMDATAPIISSSFSVAMPQSSNDCLLRLFLNDITRKHPFLTIANSQHRESLSAALG